MIIYKDFEFDMAHRLSEYKGLCFNIHGHTYKLTVGIETFKFNNIDISQDFKYIKEVVKRRVLHLVDHALWLRDDSVNKTIIHACRELNMKLIVTSFNPTAERMVIWIWENLKDVLPLYTITLFETVTSRVTINENDYLRFKNEKNIIKQ
jgi:6-pyruvoyltetrahydropterin/6-carboxytetrahydropterin synthase